MIETETLFERLIYFQKRQEQTAIQLAAVHQNGTAVAVPNSAMVPNRLIIYYLIKIVSISDMGSSSPLSQCRSTDEIN